MEHELICKRCNEKFKSRRIDALYCGNTCRTYASREGKTKGRKKRKRESSLSGIFPDATQKPSVLPKTQRQQEPEQQPQIQPQKSEPHQLTFADMPPVRGYMEKSKNPSANIPPAPQAPEPFALKRPEEIIPVFKTQAKEKENPGYVLAVKDRNESAARVAKQKAVVEAELKKWNEINDESNIGMAGYGSGIAVGGILGKEISGNFWGGFFGAALGAGVVRVIDVNTLDNFKKEKLKRLEVQKEVVRNANNQLLLSQASQKLLGVITTPKMLYYTIKIQTNGDAVEKRKREIADFEKRKSEHDAEQRNYEAEMSEYQKQYGDLLFSDDEQQEQAPEALVDNPAIISGGQLLQGRGSGVLLFQGKWLNFFGEPSRDFLIVMHGFSGSGKSHFAVQMGCYLNIHHGTVLYVSGEEGHSDTMKRKLAKYADGEKLVGYDFADIGTKEKLLDIVPNNSYNFIILDSINNMRINANDLRELADHYCCSGIIAICQSTKKGDLRGSYEVVHDAEIKIRVDNGIAYTDKNRYIDDKPELDVYNIGVPPIAKPISEKPEPSKLMLPLSPENKKESGKKEPDNDDKNKGKDEGEDGENDDWDIDRLDHII